MKLLSVIIIALSFFLLSSCLDTEETIALNSDDSGTYTIAMNMDGMLSQIKAFAPQKNMDNIQKVDSIIQFKNYLDTASNISAEDKILLHDGFIKMHVDEDKDEMSFAVILPFKNYADLPEIKQRLGDAMSTSGILEKALKTNAGDPSEENQMSIPGNKSFSVNPFEKAYKINISENSISRSILSEKYITDTLMQDSSIQTLKQMSAFLGETNYKFTFILPREAKHYSGNNISISDDKKTISFSSSITEILDDPKTLEFRIDY